MERKLTKRIQVGPVAVGGGAPVSIQSMLNTRTTDVEGSLAQIRALAAAGCEIARLAVPDMEAAEAFGDICAASPLPLVADIHFDYRLAIRAAENGAAKIRINPGNIGGEARVKAVVEACGARHIPIRIGVNGGSLEPRLLEKYGRPTPEALVESAFGHIALLEKYDFHDICVSMKSSSVPLMIEAYRLFSERSDYPLHIGVTETGTARMGTIKSAMGIGALCYLALLLCTRLGRTKKGFLCGAAGLCIVALMCDVIWHLMYVEYAPAEGEAFSIMPGFLFWPLFLALMLLLVNIFNKMFE